MTQEEMVQLENDLSALARATRFPAAPDVTSAVRRRLLAADDAPSAAPARPWGLALAGIAVAIAIGALLVGTVTPAREAAADLFDRINIFETDDSTEGVPREIEGEELTLEDAQSRVGFAITLPQSEGLEIDRVLVQDFGGENQVLAVFCGSPDGPFVFFESFNHLGKGLPDNATAAPVAGLGDEAYWLEGERFVIYYDNDGNVITGSVRATDANTLAWTDGGRFYRIEGDLTQEEALAIAETVR